MKIRTALLSALALVVLLVAVVAVAQDTPGMYVDRSGSLVKMEHAPMSGTGTKGVAKSMFVPGVSPSVVWDYPGLAAPVRVSARPRFVYLIRPNQSSISERDIVLVRMDQKGDHREIRVAKVGAWTANTRTGFDQKKLIPIAVTRKGETIEIVPAADLDAGEYFVTAGFSPVGFDFGVGGGK
jgi:hypothetical protein